MLWFAWIIPASIPIFYKIDPVNYVLWQEIHSSYLLANIPFLCGESVSCTWDICYYFDRFLIITENLSIQYQVLIYEENLNNIYKVNIGN